MIKRRFLKLVIVAFVGIFAVASQADVLFQEDWNSGLIDGAKWNLEGTASFVFDLGLVGMGSSGDYAIFLGGPYTYQDGVRSTVSFDRSDFLVATFKLWHSAGADPNYSGPCGPWTNQSAPSGALPALEGIEAGMSIYDAGKSFYVEGTSAIDDCNLLPTEFSEAYRDATTKATAVMLRVRLGSSTGAHIEYSTNGGSSFSTAYNTIGMTAGESYGIVNTVSFTDPVRLFFGSAGNGIDTAQAVVDDIVVESLCPFDVEGDLDGNCKVDLLDFALMTSNWLVDCELTPGDPGCLYRR